VVNIAPRSYQVLLSPLVKKDTYGSNDGVDVNIDISDYIMNNGISKIRKTIDGQDYEYGVLTFGDLTLKINNENKRFNSERRAYESPNGYFWYRRDFARIDINYFDGENSNSYTRFVGFIYEDNTRQDFFKEDVKFIILSKESILRRVLISGGQIGNTILFSNAIKSILNVPEITDFLNYDAGNINVNYDDTIDDGSFFDGLSAEEAMNALMIASNSVFLVDDSDNLIVKSRLEGHETHNFYGAGDVFGRENLITIKDYNEGLQRTFNSVKINDITVSDNNYIIAYGLRQKSFELPFLTNETKISAVAQNILDSVKIPRQELSIEVETNTIKNAEILDKATLNFPLRVKPAREDDLVSLYGVAKYGTSRYNQVFGEFSIDPSIEWKIISIEEDPKTFKTVIKLRQTDAGFTSYLLKGDLGYILTGDLERIFVR
jgi:hypothetical protein